MMSRHVKIKIVHQKSLGIPEAQSCIQEMTKSFAEDPSKSRFWETSWSQTSSRKLLITHPNKQVMRFAFKGAFPTALPSPSLLPAAGTAPLFYNLQEIQKIARNPTGKG